MIELTNSPISFAIIAITVIVSMMAFNNAELRDKMLFNPHAVKNYGEKWRFLSHGFIHADMMHLFFNMYVFYNFGPSVESTLTHDFGSFTGSLLFIALYVGAILFAPMGAYNKHKDNPSYNSLGASGATSAILVAFIVMYPMIKLSLLFLPIPIPGFVMGILFFVYESYMNKKGRSNVAHDAHLLGAAFGIVFLILINVDYFSSFLGKVSNFF